MTLTDTQIQRLITATMQLIDNSGTYGVFSSVEDAVRKVKASQQIFAGLSLERRGKTIQAMREAAVRHGEELAKLAHAETGFGKVKDKIAKNRLAALKTPGPEDLRPQAFTGDKGMTLVEPAPYGLIGAITPSTNPTATIINNAISMVSGGNGVIFNPHPGAKNCSNATITILNKAIASVTGIDCLLGGLANPSPDTATILFHSPDIRMLVATGGEAVVHAAMSSGKKVIGAGPGNPPVIVDDTADIAKSAKHIVDGASFDNNILCIAEKEVFVFESMASPLIEHMVREGACLVPPSGIGRLCERVLHSGGTHMPNKEWIGKDAHTIGTACNLAVTSSCRLLVCEVDGDHPLVHTELLMPVLPVVRVKNLDHAIQSALVAEKGCRHTAMMHSENVRRLTAAAKALDTTIFVKNAPSYAGLGMGGEGHTSLTIATPTGEGLTSAKSFVRSRRCVLSDSLRIV